MKIIKKLMTAAGYMLFCGTYSYVIFMNFISIPEFDTRTDAIKYFLITIVIAISLPVMLCWQWHYINKLEKKIDELENKIEDKNSEK